MKFLILATLLGMSYAARLENIYLPPNGAGGAGGGPGIAPPRNGNGNGKNGAPSGSYGPPAPKPAYGPPGGSSDAEATILSYENENSGDGNFKYSYETSNGIKAEEEGELKGAGSDNEIQSVKGSYSYTDPDGKVITIEYTADENGFVPKGDHLPTPPPIPEEILKSLEQNAAEEAAAAGKGGNGYPAANGGSNGYRY